MSKGKPIPVRFEAAESAGIADLAKATGMGEAEVVRRSVRLMLREVKAKGGFIFFEQVPLGGRHDELARAAEPPGKYQAAPAKKRAAK